MTIISTGHLILTIVIALTTWLVGFLWVDKVIDFFKKWYRVEKENCEKHLLKAHIHFNPVFSFILYLSGPILSFSIWFFLINSFVYSLMFSVVFSLITKRLGRKLSKTIYNRHLKKMKTQLIDTLGLVANALRSGLSLLQAIEMASNEMPGAISIELKKIVKDTQLGETFENSLNHFKERVPLPQIKTLVNSILILRETGGNLVETFETLTHTLREEERVQSRIKTLTTQGIAQAVVIICLPFGLAAALHVLAPDYLTPLFEHWLGWCILAFMFILQFTGAMVMKKMVTIKI